MANHKKRSNKWWDAQIVAWESSNLSMREFTSRHNIANSTFRDRLARKKNEVDLQLIPISRSVVLQQEKDTTLSGLYFELPNGARLQILNNFNSDTFARVLLSINDL